MHSRRELTHPMASRRQTRRFERTGGYSTDERVQMQRLIGTAQAVRPFSRANASAKRAATSGRAGDWPDSAAIDVTCDVAQAAGNDQIEGVERGGDVERQAVDGDAAVDVDADGGELGVARPDAGARAVEARLDAVVARRRRWPPWPGDTT